MQCEMCGKETHLLLTSVEGTELKLCKNCAKHGRVLRSLSAQHRPQHAKHTTMQASSDPEEMVLSNFAEIIKNAREKRGVTQEEFAKSINEKESVIHHIETGKMEPPIALAKKLEKSLHISLIEEVAAGPSHATASPKNASAMTLGDLIRLKKKD